MKNSLPAPRVRRIGGVLVASATAVALTACSAGAGDTAGGSKLVVTYMDSGTYNVAAEKYAPTFEKENDAKVSIEAFPFATLGQQNATDLITGTGAFDVMSTSAWDVEIYNNLDPLTKRIDGWKNRDQYIPELLKDGPSPYASGEQVGLTYASDAYGIFVNTKYLPADTTFTDWDDLVAKATALKSTLPADVVPISFAFGAADQIPSIFQGAYNSYYVNSDGKWALDEARATKAMQTIGDIAALGTANAASLSIDEANENFLAGKAAMLIVWPSFVRGALNDESRSTLGDAWAQVPFPGPGTPALSTWSLSVSKLSKNKDLAWSWIEDFLTPEHATEWMFTYGIGSPFQSTYEDPELLKTHANDLPIQAQNLAKALPLPLTLKSFDPFMRPMSEFVSGKGTAADAVAAINQGWAGLEVPKALITTGKANGFVQK